MWSTGTRTRKGFLLEMTMAFTYDRFNFKPFSSIHPDILARSGSVAVKSSSQENRNFTHKCIN